MPIRKLVYVLVAPMLVGIGVVVMVTREDSIPTDLELLEAVRTSDLSRIQRYLAEGGSPDVKLSVHGEDISLLRAAIVDREPAIALALLDAGADFGSSGATLPDVASNGLGDVLARFLPLARDQSVAYTGVVFAAASGYYDVVQRYVDGVDDRTDEWAYEFGRAAATAMMVGNDDIARLLIDAGGKDDNMLIAAARFSSPGMIRYLLSRGIATDGLDVAAAAAAGFPERTPIEFAWRRYREEVSYDQDSRNRAGPFVRNQDAKYVLYELLRAGATIDDVDLSGIAKDGLSELEALPRVDKLSAAARIGLIDIVADLLAGDQAWDEETLREAVIAALANDHDDIARLLLVFGAPVDRGVLHTASAASSAGMIRYLVTSGADPSELFDGETPLEWWLERASTQDPEYILHELIVAGADACWLLAHRDRLPGLSSMILHGSASQCWDEAHGQTISP